MIANIAKYTRDVATYILILFAMCFTTFAESISGKRLVQFDVLELKYLERVVYG